MRATGAIDTTFGNSVVMAMAWVSALNYPLDEIESSFESLGLKMKFKKWDSIFDCSFLKGAWYMVGSSVAWGPLPSRILKMGKALNDPKGLYHLTDYHEACRRFASDLAASYRPFLQTPLIRAFIGTYYTPATWQRKPFRTVSDGFYLVRPDASREGRRVVHDVDSTCRRYGIEPSDIDELERLISGGLMRFLVHPAFDRLADRDYR
jgi:hypothetical protein